jgi:hemolysin D
MEFRASAQGNNPDDHGYISGTVEFVSKSTTEDKAGARFFRIIGRITDFDLSARGLEPAFLRPGLELSVEIKAGQRRLINYIFDPFTKHFRNALKEPS